MLSNIAAGNVAQLSQLVGTPDLLPKVLAQLGASAEWDVRKEASWVISNIATGGKAAHLAHLVEQGAVTPLCELLDVAEVRILLLGMEALEAILKTGVAEYPRLIEEAGGVDKLEGLQEHENQEVYIKAVHIIETYFGGEDLDGGSENITPAVTASNTFAFGMATGNPAIDFGSKFMAAQPAAPQWGAAPKFSF